MMVYAQVETMILRAWGFGSECSACLVSTGPWVPSLAWRTGEGEAEVSAVERRGVSIEDSNRLKVEVSVSNWICLGLQRWLRNGYDSL